MSQFGVNADIITAYHIRLDKQRAFLNGDICRRTTGYMELNNSVSNKN